MALQNKGAMPSPWLAHGLWGGFRSSAQRLSGYPLMQEERAEYRVLIPEPGPWKGWWDNEDTDKALDMESSVWMLGNCRASLSTPDSAFNRSLPPSESRSSACSGAISSLRTAA